MILVSACLAGIRCRWDGTASPCREVTELVEKGEAIPLCPEMMGGLPVPRPRMELRGGEVITEDGKNATAELKKGAEAVLAIARRLGCKTAILKAHSPACGAGEVYDGTFSGKLVPGNGILAELLIKEGLDVVSNDNISNESGKYENIFK